jgi:hypothetical protein
MRVAPNLLRMKILIAAVHRPALAGVCRWSALYGKIWWLAAVRMAASHLARGRMDCEPTFLRLSLAEVPERDRAVTLKEVFGRGIVNMDFTPLTDDPQLEVQIHLFPGVAVTSSRNSPFFSDSGFDPSRESDDLAFVWATSPCKAGLKHLGKEVVADDGAAVLISCADRVSAGTRTNGSSLTVRMQRSLLLPLLPDAEAALMHNVSPDNAALQLLTTYLEVLIANKARNWPLPSLRTSAIL